MRATLIFATLLSLASFSQPVTAGQSSDAFNKFINASPKAKEDMAEVAAAEEISAACFTSAAERVNGVTVTKSGNIYSWYLIGSDTRQVKTLAAQNTSLTNPVFALKNQGNFEQSELDYKPDGTSYCYVQTKMGTSQKKILWPKNEIMTGHKKVPTAAKDLFKATVNAYAYATGKLKK